MNQKSNPNIEAFQNDVVSNGGYQYTTNAPLSSQMANERLTKATIDSANFIGANLIDIGCGDGTYTFELLSRGNAKSVVGIDPATDAINLANKKTGLRNATFIPASAYDLPYPNQTFYFAILRGVLHHLEFPEKAIKEALRVSKEIIVIEPNGFNPVLKLIEKNSSYHKAHDEKSYTSWKLFQWVRAGNGKVENFSFVGLVPFFSPNWMAKICKLFEPVVESFPILRRICCAVCVFKAKSYHESKTQVKDVA